MKQERPSFKETRNHYAQSWADIVSRLPDDLNPHVTKFVRDYFRAQLRIVQGQRTKARRILAGLDDRYGFREFEDSHQSLLAAVDIAVRGRTSRPVKPSFDLED